MTITTTRTPPNQADYLAGTWHVDAGDSHARFTAGTLAGLVEVHGRFRGLAGTLSLGELGTTGALMMSAASVDTSNRLRDRHLRSRSFFGVARHPVLSYELDSLEVDRTTVIIDGELIVAGRRTRLPLAAELRRQGDDAVEIACRTQVDRLALGIRGARGIVPRTVDLDVTVVLRRA